MGLLESRRSVELAELVRRLGGNAVTAPAVREVPHIDEVARLLDSLEAGHFEVVVLLTGAGARVLFGEAERRGRLDVLLTALCQTITVCRGPKPSTVLHHYRVPVRVVPAKPYTSRELLEALVPIDLHDRPVALVHYGERNRALSEALTARGARLTEVCPYEWTLPDDLEPLRALIRDAVGKRLDAVAFTSQIQCRHLLQVAARMGLADQLTAALAQDIIVAAIGPVCAETLREFGVMPDVLPSNPKMGALIAALADYADLTADLAADN